LSGGVGSATVVSTMLLLLPFPPHFPFTCPSVVNPHTSKIVDNDLVYYAMKISQLSLLSGTFPAVAVWGPWIPVSPSVVLSDWVPIHLFL